MLRLKEALGACMLATALVSTVAAHAATYYVATTGNNSNPGTEDQPWRTIGKAVSTMVAGDTTYVRRGTYSTEQVIRFLRSGTAAAPIKLLNYPGEAPVIDFQDKSSARRMLIQHANGINVAVGWITIEGFEIKNSWDGIKFHNLHDAVIRRNWIHDNINQGILGNGPRVLIDRNIISHNGDFPGCAAKQWICNQKHAIYGHGPNWTITNNLMYDNLSYGVHQNGSDSSVYDPNKHPGPEFAGAQNWIIANNTMAYHAWRSGIAEWGSLTAGTRIENNIFYENSVNEPGATNGIEFVGANSTSGITIRNNHAYASGSGATSFILKGTEGVHYTQSNNVVNVSSPAFVNGGSNSLPAAPNFALTARSPAIDVGVSLATTKIAFDGTTRPQGRAFDIGAYEYTAGGDAQSPAAPRGLRSN